VVKAAACSADTSFWARREARIFSVIIGRAAGYCCQVNIAFSRYQTAGTARRFLKFNIHFLQQRVVAKSGALA
jgi:hypothetical protein